MSVCDDLRRAVAELRAIAAPAGPVHNAIGHVLRVEWASDGPVPPEAGAKYALLGEAVALLDRAASLLVAVAAMPEVEE